MGMHGLLPFYKTLIKASSNVRGIIYRLNEPSFEGKERHERILMSAFNNDLIKSGQPMSVILGRFTFKEIVGINKVVGHPNPKADLALVQYDDATQTLTDVGFFSHKDGSKADSFQQYSGITSDADGTTPGAISDHPEVRDFRAIIEKNMSLILNQRKSFFRPIHDETLVGRAVFGPAYQTGHYGPNNVHAVAQGGLKPTQPGKSTRLTFATHLYMNGDVTPFMRGDYQAVLLAAYREDRGVRFFIISRKKAGGKAVEI